MRVKQVHEPQESRISVFDEQVIASVADLSSEIDLVLLCDAAAL